MSILVIQGPHHHGDAAACTTSGDLAAHVRAEALAAGTDVRIRRCTSALGLVRCLHEARGAEVVLLDSGDLDPAECSCHADALRDALDTLDAPYIEVHDRTDQELEGRLQPAHAALAIVVTTTDLAMGYAISTAIALAHRRRKATRSVSSVAPHDGGLAWAS